MGTDFSDTFAGGEVGESECVVCGDCVEDLGGEGPLEVEDGCFGVTLEEAVVCVWGIGAP